MTLPQYVDHFGFVGELRKIFFQVSKDSICLKRLSVTRKFLNDNYGGQIKIYLKDALKNSTWILKYKNKERVITD